MAERSEPKDIIIGPPSYDGQNVEMGISQSGYFWLRIVNSQGEGPILECTIADAVVIGLTILETARKIDQGEIDPPNIAQGPEGPQ